ncbi:uncharacterized protein LOC111904184 [Lactuca sativa]|uniref:uncharacterized protein LOC111904184 n=1 Tax=Lactuca sativa TaxID=4236 RepID=UPI000CD8AC73|nr:uncharacterized protein LOC111904184 [Lactuca sativa]
MGDFNEVRDDSEILGSNFNMSFVRVFNDFIDSLDLVDIPLGGPHFTWSDKWSSKFSKLDRFLVMEGFLVSFQYLSTIVLEKNIPDHRPILLLEHRVDYGPLPFRLFHSWFDMAGFDNFLLKSKLGVWNSNHRDMVGIKRKNMQDLLETIDSSIMEDEGYAILREQRVSLLKEMSDLDHLLQVDLAQKAKIQWGDEGDENSIFFQGILNRKRRQIAICGLMIDGVCVD